jgi:tRNA A-37 threonylcarbamoyl transferase component Bud32
MFEKRLKELSKKIGEKQIRKFYILTHKKHFREIYFQNNKEAIKFLDNKLNTPLKKFRQLKKFIYFLIRANLLQPFLKKIKLSSEFGEVIFVGGQIKGFNLNKKEVISFPTNQSKKREFIESKKIQERFSKKKVTPKILEINEKIPFSKEKLLKEYNGGRNIEVFKQLIKFYKKEGIKKVQLKDYVKEIIKDKEIDNNYVKGILKEFSKINKKILVTKLHGDFAKENILVDENNKILFIDWNQQEGLITEDLINFFRGEKNLLENEKFKKILKEVFPKEVQKNIEVYVKLHKIFLII